MLSNLKILPRLFIAFGLLILLIAGLSAFAILSNQSSEAYSTAALRLRTAELLDQRAEKRAALGRLFIWMALATGDQEQ